MEWHRLSGPYKGYRSHFCSCPKCNSAVQEICGPVITEPDRDIKGKQRVVIPFRCEAGHLWQLQIRTDKVEDFKTVLIAVTKE